MSVNLCIQVLEIC